MKLVGRTVLITGAARGIGRELVRAFLQEGARIFAADVSWSFVHPSADDSSFDELTRDNRAVVREVMDISIDSHVKRGHRIASACLGPMDVIINNGGMRARDLYPDSSGMIGILETEAGDWQRMFETHVFGTLRVIKAFVPSMVAHGGGSIINVGSLGQLAALGTTREGPYQPSKAAMHYLTFMLSEELRDKNIAANVLCPGHTHTTGSDEVTKVRFPPGGGVLPRRYRADSAVPLALFLAAQNGGGVTGRAFGVPQWNEENGHGNWENWAHPADLAAREASR